MTEPIKAETSRWSELPDFVERYNAEVQAHGGGVGRIFGYASIIGNHSAEKPENSASIPNEKAKLQGMEVAMNVYATGQYELRGTRDAENGIYNVGLYAGMEPALTENGYAEGLNITVAPEDAAQSFKAYLKREIGNPPGGGNVDDFIAQDEKGAIRVTAAGQDFFESLRGSPEDEFGLYKLQIANVTRDDGSHVPALSVSTNENSAFSAIGLTPKQAAHYILDGQGYTREVDGRPLGGSAVDYFKNTLASYDEYGVNQPRMREIAGEVVAMAEAYQQFDTLAQNPDASREAIVHAASALIKTGLTDTVNGQKHFVSTRVFKDDLIERGAAPDHVKQVNNLPQTGEEKIGRIAELLDSGALDALKDVRSSLEKSGVQPNTSNHAASPSIAARPRPDKEKSSPQPSL